MPDVMIDVHVQHQQDGDQRGDQRRLLGLPRDHSSYRAVVFSRTSAAVTSGASSISLNRLSWSGRWNTHRSVMIMSTTFLPVRGSVHSGMNFGSPFLDVCSITTMIFLTPATRSIAPPMPLIILPGIIQLAMSPFSLTSIAPSTVKSMCPPRIIAKLSDELK